jgi:hypothetical protein
LVSAVLLVTACVLAAGCGGGKRNAGTHKAAAPAPKACHLSAAQKDAIARARADIRRLQRIQAPLHTFSQRGTPAQERVTGQFLTDLTRVKLPIDTRATLIHKAKAAVGLCGLCFHGLEAEEPVVSGHLGEPRCS